MFGRIGSDLTSIPGVILCLVSIKPFGIDKPIGKNAADTQGPYTLKAFFPQSVARLVADRCRAL